MFPVDSNSSVRYVAQSSLPPPRVTVKPHDTVESIAKTFHVTPEELARSNHIATTTTLAVGQKLTLPPNAVQPVQTEAAPQTTQTPSQKTDAAYKAYQQAKTLLASDKRSPAGHADVNADSAAAAQAKQAFDTALKAEIAGNVATANAGVPPQYRTPESQQITQFGDDILKRYASDSSAQADIKSVVADYQVQRQAENLIPGYSGDWSAADKLKGIILQGQPQAVIDKVLADPRVQGWLKQAAADVGKPYDGVSEKAAGEDQQAALDASKQLLDATSGMPPQLAAELVRQSMPTIQKIAGVDANYSGSGPFDNLSRVVGALGDTTEAKQLTTEIASAYSQQLKTWSGRFEDPFTGSIKTTVADGASPALSLELAKQLQQAGKDQDAGAILNDVEKGVEGLQATAKHDLEDYAKLTEKLNWAIKNLGPNLTPEQLDKGIQTWIDKQPQDWKDKFQAAQQKMISDGKAIIADIGALTSLPPELKATSSGAIEALKQSLANDKDTQSVLQFAMSKDSTLFAGKSGDAAASFLTEACAKSKEFVAKLGPAYVSAQVLPALSTLNPNDPASVQKAYQTLESFRTKAAAMLGVPQSEVDAGVKQLKTIIADLHNESLQDAMGAKGLKALDKTTSELGELKEMTFSNGTAGILFRTLGLGIAGASLMNYAGRSIDDPKVSNILYTMAATVGLAQDAGSFATTVKLVDDGGSLSQWATATSLAGRITEKFVGVLSAGAFAAGVFESTADHNPAGAIFNGVGVAGSLLATFGEAAGLGSWAGPVGVGVAFVAAAGVALVEYRANMDEHTELSEEFYEDAGVNENVKDPDQREASLKALASEASGQTTQLQKGMNLSPEALQALAVSHPELFDVNPSQTQAVINAAKACGISSEDFGGFVDSLEKGNPQYLSLLGAQDMSGTSGSHPLSYAAQLFETASHIPGVLAYIQAHAPQSVGAEADARRHADRDYEIASGGDQVQIANLLKGNHDTAYRAEIIKILKDSNRLDGFVKQFDTQGSYQYNDWPEAVRDGILAAEGTGVLSQEQGQVYVNELG
ncbi:LysM peptidoglycan-binding domain-containing protein [Rhodanobacter sp. Col0626]|uniref:LysM peptidoglycan-binding domain-containing protein n=1 Tax=Rhodanobacter sp. Col0626 TaxID=3415679 RepID=UPI003CE6A3E6